jgi:hypothetical protein
MHAVAECRGGFFHTPAGLQRSAPDGAPFFAQLESDGATIALAAGIWKRCRLSPLRRHVYLPTYPAFTDPGRHDAALGALVRLLREAGAAEFLLDSFDASDPTPDAPAGADRCEWIQRQEYVVVIGQDRVLTGHGFSEHHRRHLKRAEMNGWTLRLPTGDAASALLADAQGRAAARAAKRGSAFTIRPWKAVAPGWPADSGEQVFAAYSGATPLSVALVGWANRRAYSVSAGSTSEGYALTSAVWLHWRIMRLLAEAGFASYNLGGTPLEATEPHHPLHGLYRFKSGFRPEVVRCRTIRRVLRRSHDYAHTVARRVQGWLRREVATG